MSDTLTFQASLLDQTTAEPTFDPTFAHLRRHRLPDAAWIDRQPGWVSGADQLYQAAEAHLPWRTGTERIRGSEVARPRLVASVDRDALPPDLRLLGLLSDALSHRYGVRLDAITCNLYRNGRDSVAWHGDRVARDLPEAIVAIVSLGEPRPFRVRPRGGGSSLSWSAGHGDLLVMGGSCQRTCEHSVPKVAAAGPRIALMYRVRR
ncbi:MAG: alpha-ketoglutarate-dependent dioxygenase AlkB [Actinobacteria bacterium]|nr:alpha-ketoglutarate-dependent dioxygenase AlkB [Actinomycetota bacterium]